MKHQNQNKTVLSYKHLHNLLEDVLERDFHCLNKPQDLFLAKALSEWYSPDFTDEQIWIAKEILENNSVGLFKLFFNGKVAYEENFMKASLYKCTGQIAYMLEYLINHIYGESSSSK